MAGDLGPGEYVRKALEAPDPSMGGQWLSSASGAKLNISDLDLEDALEAAGLGVFRWRVGTQDFVWSRNLYQLTGRTADFSVTLDSSFACIHPDHRVETMARLLDAVSTGIPQDVEFELVRPDGTSRVCWAKAKPQLKNSQTVMITGIVHDITERRLAEQRLRESEEYYRNALELSPQIPWTAEPDGRVTAVGGRWADTTGLPAEVAQGDGWMSVVHPEDADAALRSIRHSIDTGRPIDLRARMASINGDYRWMRLRGSPLRDEQGRIRRWYGVSEDIQTQVDAEDALRISNERLRMAAEGVGMGSWDFDLKSRTGVFSDRGCQLLGYTPDEARSWTMDLWRARIHPEDAEASHAHTAQAKGSSKAHRAEYRIIRADNGEVRWIESTSCYIRTASGEASRHVGVFFDITDRKNAERKLAEATERFQRVSRLSAMGAMASTLAHELNQPLAAASNYLAAARRLQMKQNEVNSTFGSAITGAASQVHRAGEIIRRIRKFAATGQVQRQAVPLVAIVEQAHRAVADAAAASGVTIHVCIDGAALVDVDSIQIEQVLVNLLRNAIQATSESSVRKVEVSARHSRGYVEVQVSDTGHGLTVDRLADLFSPLKSTKSDGLGMGLPICRTIIEAHGGRIWAEPKADGALFKVTLPRTLAEGV